MFQPRRAPSASFTPAAAPLRLLIRLVRCSSSWAPSSAARPRWWGIDRSTVAAEGTGLRAFALRIGGIGTAGHFTHGLQSKVVVLGCGGAAGNTCALQPHSGA